MKSDKYRKLIKIIIISIIVNCICICLFSCGINNLTANYNNDNNNIEQSTSNETHESLEETKEINESNETNLKLDEIESDEEYLEYEKALKYVYKDQPEFVEKYLNIYKKNKKKEELTDEEIEFFYRDNPEMISIMKNRKPKTGTDANGHPYLQKGQEYTFKDNGMGEPVEAPRGLKRTAVNPNTGVKYSYLDDPDCRWIVNTREEDEEIARLKMQKDYVGGTNGDLVKGRKLTEEEARKFAKMFSDSFK